jgi:hypothetical protein
MVLVLLVPFFTRAAVVSFDIAEILDGSGVPAKKSPWVSIIFEDSETASGVDMLINSSGLDGDNEKVKSIYFNLNPILDPKDLVFSEPEITGKVEVPVIRAGSDAFKAGGFGYYDVRIDFNNSRPQKAFNGGEIIKYRINTPLLNAGSFNFESSSRQSEPKYKAAAHLISLGENDDSAWVSVPEPATIVLLGLSGLIFARRN